MQTRPLDYASSPTTAPTILGEILQVELVYQIAPSTIFQTKETLLNCVFSFALTVIMLMTRLEVAWQNVLITKPMERILQEDVSKSVRCISSEKMSRECA